MASLFGGSQYDPNNGWAFLVKGTEDIGSVGVPTAGHATDLDAFKTLGISTADGDVTWSEAGYHLCGGGLQFF